MSDTTLTDAQGPGDTGLADDIAAAMEEQEGADIIEELASAPDDAEPTPPATPRSDADAPETDGEALSDAVSGAETPSNGGADRTEETDPPPAATREEADAGSERGTDATPEHRQVAEAFHAAVAPYQAHLASKGVAPSQAVRFLLAAEHQLSTGTPEQKAHIFGQLAKDYGIDLYALADMVDEPANPELTQVHQRIAGIERMINGERQQVAAQAWQEVEGRVAAFAGEKDAAGNLQHPHLGKVQSAMGRLIEQDPKLTLEQAYDNAVWGEPSLREQVLAKRRAAVASKPVKAKKAKPARGPTLRDELTRQHRRAVERANA